MKRILALFLVLALMLPVFSLAESDEEDINIEDIIEDLDYEDEEGEEGNDDDFDAEALAAQQPLSEELQDELKSVLESKDYVPTELDIGVYESSDLFINNKLPDNIINILLLGVDTRNSELEVDDVKLADVQMILSFNTETGSVKLSSVLRDTLVENPYTGKQSPINESIQYFGKNKKFHDNPQRAIATINHNFELNVQSYVMINFRGVAAIVDKLGGIDLELTEGEAANINYYLKKNAKSISKRYDTKEAKAARVELKVEDGVQHLDGLQALMYARLRQNKTKKKYNLGNDWQRTARARNLLDKLLQKVLKKDVWDIIDLASFGIDYVDTNMNLDTMSSMILKVLGSGIVSKLGSTDSIIEQFRIPMDDTWSYVQEGDWKGKIFMSKRNGNFQKNVEALHEFIFGRYYPANAQ